MDDRSPVDAETIAREIVARIEELNKSVAVDTPLVGEKAVLKSRDLVEVLLSVEEYAEERLGVAFDWSSDAAMSQRRSIFRTPRSLAAHLAELAAHQGRAGGA
jgi:hypothetical protein